MLVERGRLERRAEVHGAHDRAVAHLEEAVIDAGADAADVDEDALGPIGVDHLLPRFEPFASGARSHGK